MTVKELNKVKRYLKPEDKKKIAKKYKVTAVYIRAILRGDRRNEIILDELIDMALHIKSLQDAKKEKRSQKISKL